MPTPDRAQINRDSFIALFRYVQKKIFTTTTKINKSHADQHNIFYVPPNLAPIASKVAKALEAQIAGKTEELRHKLADIVICTMDFAESLEIDLATEIINKADFNADKPFKHGNKLY